MNNAATIYQCQTCNRQFALDASGTGALSLLDRPRLCAPTMFHCQLADCAEVAESNRQREAARDARRWQNRRDRHAANQECRQRAAGTPRATASRSRGGEPHTFAERSLPPEPPEPSGEAPGPVLANDEANAAASSVGTNVGAVVEKAMSQKDFVASGQADSQNAKLLEFFSHAHNFGKWFKSTFLEELSGATRMNNRAIDLRPVFIERGHYIDNCMMTDSHTDRKASYYRVCNIEDAVSLSQEQKARLIRPEDGRQN